MKPGTLLILAFFVPSLFCHAQDKEPAGKPAEVAAPALPAAIAADSYVIGASDVLAVTGMTPLQLADQIAAKLQKFMQDPKVSVVLTQINSKKVFLLGEVGKKGPIEMTPGMTLLEAIGSAGGLTDYANAKKIYILRDEAGKHQKIPVHYKEALKGDSTFNLVLKPGDTIVVP